MTQDVFLDRVVLVLVFFRTMPCARPSLKSSFKVLPLRSEKVKVLPTTPFHRLWFGVGGCCKNIPQLSFTSAAAPDSRSYSSASHLMDSMEVKFSKQAPSGMSYFFDPTVEHFVSPCCKVLLFSEVIIINIITLIIIIKLWRKVLSTKVLTKMQKVGKQTKIKTGSRVTEVMKTARGLCER